MDTLRLVSIGLCIFGIILYLIIGAYRKTVRLYLIAPLTWLGFTLAFLVGSYAHQIGLWDISPASLNAWSAATRLYSLIVVIGVGFILAFSRRGNINGIK